MPTQQHRPQRQQARRAQRRTLAGPPLRWAARPARTRTTVGVVLLSAAALVAVRGAATAAPGAGPLDAPTTGRIAFAGTGHRGLGAVTDPVADAPVPTRPLFGAGPTHFDDQPAARGDQVVFTSRRDEPRPQVYLRLAGGAVRRLTTGRDAGHPQLSADRQLVVFDSAEPLPNGAGSQRDLWLVRTDGTGLRRLTDTPADETSPTLAPDGTRIAFASDRGGDSQLYRQPLGGGPAQQLTGEPGVTALEPAWNPVNDAVRGNRIAYTADLGAGSQPRLQLRLLDGTALPVPLLGGGQAGWQGSAPAWQPDGDGLLFLSPNRPCTCEVDGIQRVYQVDTAVGVPVTATPGLLLDEDRSVGSPTWLVDAAGPQLVVARTTAAGPTTATLQDIRPDGADPRDLGLPILREDPRVDPTGDPLFNPRPGFDPWTVRQDYSPDGRQLALSRFTDAVDLRVERIWLAGADGSGPRQLPIADRSAADWETDAAWSPDGRLLALARRSPGGLAGAPGVGPSRVILVEVATGAVVGAVPAVDGLDDAQPAWSPDGATIVFTRVSPTGGKHIRTAQAGALDQQRDVSAAVCGGDCDVVDDSPAFSPDGLHIAFNRKDDAVLLADATGAGCRVLLPAGQTSCAIPLAAPAGPFQPRDVAFAPDGTRVVLTSRRAAALDSPEALSILDLTTGARNQLGGDLPGRQKEPAWQPAPPVQTPPPTTPPTSAPPPPPTTSAPAPPPPAPPGRPPAPANPRLSVAVRPVPGFVGGQVSVTVTARNTGGSPATGLRLELRLPARVPVVTVTAGCALAGCPLGDLAPGGSRTVTAVLAPNAALRSTVSGTVRTTGTDANPADNTATAPLRVLQPRIIAVPPIGKPGFVTLVRGVDFPAGVPVRLVWSPGITVAAVPTRPRADGTFTAQLLILFKDQTGPRTITASGPGFRPVSTPFLVVVGTIGPPTETERR